MDMTPPQAPPAVTRGAHQDALDTVQRITDVERWLLTQQARLPTAPASTGLGIIDTQDIRQPLDAFWDASADAATGGQGLTRSTLLGQQLATLMKDEARLRLIDGSLGESAAAWAVAFAGSSGGTLPPHLHAHELILGDAAYAGAVIVTNDRNDSLALLFSPDRGWDEFANMVA